MFGSGLRSYLLRRLLIGGVVLVGISLVSFAFVYLLPGDPVTSRYPNITADQRERIRDQMGLNDPLPSQYVRYIHALSEGNWGYSYNTGRPVTVDLVNRVPASLEIALYGLLVAAAFGIPLGAMAAVNGRNLTDGFIRALTSATLSLPIFWTSLLLIFLFFYILGIAPAPVGRLPIDTNAPPTVTGLYTIDSIVTGHFSSFWPSVRQLALPVAALAIFLIGPITRISRAAFLGVLEQRYILAARALGVPERKVLIQNALPNSALSIITLAAVMTGYVVTGDALVEKVFSWSGLGLYMVDAAVASDRAVIQGGLLILAIVTLSIHLVLDVVYAALDPRIRAQYKMED
jgi:ABC-type dipeptide/oligopeptide/nickel transport system permease component